MVLLVDGLQRSAKLILIVQPMVPLIGQLRVEISVSADMFQRLLQLLDLGFLLLDDLLTSILHVLLSDFQRLAHASQLHVQLPFLLYLLASSL